MRQPPARRTTAATPTSAPPAGVDPDVWSAAMGGTTPASAVAPSKPETESPTSAFLRRAGETAQDVMAAGLSNVPGAPTAIGALTMLGTGGKTSIKEGAQQFQELVRRAPERSGQAVAGPFSPAALAGGAIPYLLTGAGQATRLGRALYSAAVGGTRGAERAALNEEEPADIAKSAGLGAAMEAASGFLLGEPAGSTARAMRTPTRTEQFKAAQQATRTAEAPLYEAFTGYTGRGQPITRGPLPRTPQLAAALKDPTVKAAINVARKNPDFATLPATSPVLLDRAYKVIGQKAFTDKYSVPTEAMKSVRDLLRTGMDEASPSLPYSNVLDVARSGRQTEEAIVRGAEAMRLASRSSPGTMATALKKGETSFTDFLKNASPEQRAAAAEAVYGYTKEAPTFASIPLGMRTRLPIPFIPSRATMQASRIAELAGSRPTALQRGVRGAVASAPSALQNALSQFFF